MNERAGNVVRVGGQSVAVDHEGFLLQASDWTPAVAEALARRDGQVLGEDHWWLIEFVRDHQARYGNPPLMRVVVGALRERQPGATSRDLYRLFPDGPVRLACKYGGLPRPDWCI